MTFIRMSDEETFYEGPIGIALPEEFAKRRTAIASGELKRRDDEPMLWVNPSAALALQAQMKLYLGETGKFPQGKVNEQDEGELKMAVGVDLKAGIVGVHFGKEIAWLGLDAKTARDLGKSLIYNAALLEKSA